MPSRLSDRDGRAREQTVLNIFGRLNLTENPYRDLNEWTDGTHFYRPFFHNPSELDAPSRANGDTIYLFGGTLHEGGYGMMILLAADGKMTVAEDYYPDIKKGDRVERRVLGDETILIFTDARTGGVKDVLKKFDGNLTARYINDIHRYMLAGQFKRKDGSGGTVVFDHAKSVLLYKKGHAPLFVDSTLSVQANLKRTRKVRMTTTVWIMRFV